MRLVSLLGPFGNVSSDVYLRPGELSLAALVVGEGFIKIAVIKHCTVSELHFNPPNT